MACQQPLITSEAIQSVLKYYGYNEDEAISSLNYYKVNNTSCNNNSTQDTLTPPHDIEIFRSHCIDLSNNTVYYDEVYEVDEDEYDEDQIANNSVNYNSLTAEEKVKNLELALRIAKERIGDLWMELYNERRKRIALEEQLQHILFV